MTDRRAIFPGSFDPFTLGHLSVINKALPLFDRIFVAIGQNSTKQPYFSLDERLSRLKEIFQNQPKVEVITYTGLTVDACRQYKCTYIIRGIRNSTDYNYESSIEQMNRVLAENITTVLFVCEPKYAAIHSSIVREIHRNGGDISAFIPKSTDH
ncbi:MAG: pantetheine-phosphate adenylyltransferase [Salibacteraceae bacterium]